MSKKIGQILFVHKINNKSYLKIINMITNKDILENVYIDNECDNTLNYTLNFFATYYNKRYQPSERPETRKNMLNILKILINKGALPKNVNGSENTLSLSIMLADPLIVAEILIAGGKPDNSVDDNNTFGILLKYCKKLFDGNNYDSIRRWNNILELIMCSGAIGNQNIYACIDQKCDFLSACIHNANIYFVMRQYHHFIENMNSNKPLTNSDYTIIKIISKNINILTQTSRDKLIKKDILSNILISLPVCCSDIIHEYYDMILLNTINVDKYTN